MNGGAKWLHFRKHWGSFSLCRGNQFEDVSDTALGQTAESENAPHPQSGDATSPRHSLKFSTILHPIGTDGREHCVERQRVVGTARSARSPLLMPRGKKDPNKNLRQTRLLFTRPMFLGAPGCTQQQQQAQQHQVGGPGGMMPGMLPGIMGPCMNGGMPSPMGMMPHMGMGMPFFLVCVLRCLNVSLRTRWPESSV